MSYYLIIHDASGEYILLNSENSHGTRCPQIPYFTDDLDVCDFAELSCNMQEVLTGEECEEDSEQLFNVRYMKRSEFFFVYVMEVRCQGLPTFLDKYTWTKMNSEVQKVFDYLYPPVVAAAIRNMPDERDWKGASYTSIPRMFYMNNTEVIKRRFKRRIVKAGFATNHSTEQVRTGPDYMVLNLKTSTGLIYCKQSGLGCPEALVTKVLGSYLPGIVVVPFLVDSKTNSFCTNEFWCNAARKVFLDEVERRGLKKEFEINLAQLIYRFHRKAQKLTPAMEDIGVEETTPRTMKKRFDWFLEKLDIMDILPQKDIARLQSLSVAVNNLLDELIASTVPLTVCHGDLSPGNIAVDVSLKKKVRLHNWYECTISHPFLDFASSKYTNKRMKEVYLASWSEYDNALNLARLYAIAEKLQYLWTSFRLIRTRIRCFHFLNCEEDQRLCRQNLEKFMESIGNG